jgi:DNA repair/transcription protein MET18/MMS19
MPSLIRCLDLPDIEIRAEVIDIFISSIGNDSTEHSFISEHASTLVSIMLKNSMISEASSTVRNVFCHSRVDSHPHLACSDCSFTVLRHLA